MSNALWFYRHTVRGVVFFTGGSGLLTGIVANAADGAAFTARELNKADSVGAKNQKRITQHVPKKSDDRTLESVYGQFYVRLIGYTAVGIATGIAYPITFPICIVWMLQPPSDSS